MRHSVALAVLGVLLAAGTAFAEDAASRWTGFYAGGDLGADSGDTPGSSATPCHVACRSSANIGGHGGYGQEVGHSGLYLGGEGDGLPRR